MLLVFNMKAAALSYSSPCTPQDSSPRTHLLGSRVPRRLGGAGAPDVHEAVDWLSVCRNVSP